MKCFYINLDSAVQRREAMEESFRQTGKAGWSLARVPAFDAKYVRDNTIKGTLTDTEKACFLSHKKVLADNLAHDEHIFVLEDDERFGAQTCEMLEELIKSADAQLEWDLLYTDISVPSIEGMSELLKLRRNLASERATTLLDLKPYLFYSASAFVVNKKAKSKLHGLADSQGDLNIAYDNFLRGLIQASNIKGFVAFPFITTPSPLADTSTIRGADLIRLVCAWNSFRRMVWREGNWENEKQRVVDISHGISVEAQAYGALWACMIEPVLKDSK